MMTTKNPAEIQSMQEGGKKLGSILDVLLSDAQTGVQLIELEERARDLIKNAGGTPSFMTVEDYKWATCLCVNNIVVHGIPSSYALRSGDVLTIDIGMVYEGLHTDTAWTKIITDKQKPNDVKVSEFLKTGEIALKDAISEAKIGNRVGHISQMIGTRIEGSGYGIVRSLVGHGVGKALHEEPQIPGFLRGPIENTRELLPGLTIAIEVIYAMGKGAVVYTNDDGWSIGTKDNSISAVFEHTIVITKNGPVILTLNGQWGTISST